MLTNYVCLTLDMKLLYEGLVDCYVFVPNVMARFTFLNPLLPQVVDSLFII